MGHRDRRKELMEEVAVLRKIARQAEKLVEGGDWGWAHLQDLLAEWRKK